MASALLLGVMVIANCVYGFGAFFGIGGTWGVQDLIQDVRCDPAANDTEPEPANSSCCASCLGLSAVEYNMYTAFAFWSALPLLLVTGYLVDSFGAPRCALLFAGAGVLGAVLRLAGSLLGGHHSLCLALLAVGEALASWAYNMAVLIRNYVAGHYFPPGLRPVSTSCAYSFSMAAFVVAFYCVAPFGHRFGLPASFGLILAGCSLSLGAALVIWRCAAALTDARAAPGGDEAARMTRAEEDEEEEEASRPMGARAVAADIWGHVRGACGLLLVLMMVSAATTHGDLSPFSVNAILLLVDCFGLDTATAANCTGAAYVVIVLASPLVGLAIRRLGWYEGTITAAGAGSALAFALLNFARRLPPLVPLLVLGVAEAMGNSTAAALISVRTPATHLGVTMGLAVIAINASIGLLSALTGLLVQYSPTRRDGWAATLLLYAAFSLLMSASGAAMLAMRRCAARRRPVREGSAEDEDSAL